MTPERASSATRRQQRCSGFTLLELFVAFTLLAIFILPMLTIVHRSRVRSINYSTENELRELAQRKLFDRIYSYSEESVAAGPTEAISGTFEAEGRPEWSWEIHSRTENGAGSQPLVWYGIYVDGPQLESSSRSSSLDDDSNAWASRFGSMSSAPGRFANSEPVCEVSVLPSIFWYLEQEALIEAGFDPLGGFDGISGMGGF